MRYNDGFIGADPHIEFNFSLIDSEQEYLKNLNTQPQDWYFRHHIIDYKYNEYGHRSKPINELDLDNYILFAGCSHVEGVGLSIEHTFSHIVASQLKCDYYNLAVNGSGVDVMLYNLVLWINRFKKMPKALVILWPEETRFALHAGNNLDPQVLNNYDTSDEVSRFMAIGDEIEFFSTRRRMCRELLSHLYTCKIIDIRFAGQEPLETPIAIYAVDFARDLSHAGIQSNLNLANDLITILKGSKV